MKIETNPYINWNTTPFKMDDKISRHIRVNLSDRLYAAIANLRDHKKYNNLKLEDGWCISSKDNVVFIINSDKNEDLPNNADLQNQTLDSGRLGAKLREIEKNVWDSRTYEQLSKVKNLTIDPTTGKITCKVI